MLTKKNAKNSKEIKIYNRYVLSPNSSLHIDFKENTDMLDYLIQLEIKARECLSELKDKRREYIEKLLGKFLGDNKLVYLTTKYYRGGISSKDNNRVKGVLVLCEDSGIGDTITTTSPIGTGYSLRFYPIKKDGHVSLKYVIIYLHELSEGKVTLELCEEEE